MSARPASYFAPLATVEQLDQIRELGGHPPEGLTYSQALRALSVLRSKRRRLAGERGRAARG